jgi:cyclopropane fatty-acyl-phospholipid synthase-like methyltransferase
MSIDYSRHYRKWHDDTPEHEAAMRAFYERMLGEHLPADRAARILDVGCGMGFALLTLRAMGYTSVSGVEADEAQARASQARGLEVALTSDTVGWLKERRAGYEVLLALDLIEHVPLARQLEFVAAMCGALTPGGRLLCTVPNANSALAARWRYIDWTHHCSFTEHSLDFLLFNAGFTDIRILPTEFNQRPLRVWLPVRGARHWWAFRFFRWWRRLEMMAELGPAQGRAVPLSLNLLAVARKA